MGLQRAAKPEAEERATAAHLVDQAKRRPRQDEVQPRVQQLVHGAEREWSDHERGEALVLDEPEPRQGVGADTVRQQDSDRFLTQPPPRE